MHGSIRLATLLSLLSPVALAAPPAPPAPLEFSGSAWVDVDASGRAHVVEMEKVAKLGDVPKLASVAERINARLKERIESWEFIPATRGREAVPSRTHVVIALEGTDDGAGDLVVRIVSASTGAGIRERDMAGVMKAFFQRPEESALVADIHYAGDGSVSDVQIVESRKFGGFGTLYGEADQRLQKGIVNALKRWVFIPEQVDGQPAEGHGRLPISFCSSKACEKATAAFQASVAGAPEFSTTDPVATLRTAVAGTAL